MSALSTVRQMHKKACESIVADVKDGNLDPEVAHIDIQGISDQAKAWRSLNALLSHHMISEETYQKLRSLAK